MCIRDRGNTIVNIAVPIVWKNYMQSENRYTSKDQYLTLYVCMCWCIRTLPAFIHVHIHSIRQTVVH